MNDFADRVTETKDNLQEDLLILWKNNGFVGTIQAVGGFGKTILGCKAIVKMIEKDPSRIVGIIVPSVVVENQWKSVIKKDYPSLISNVKVRTIDFLVENEGELTSCYAVVVDEIHEMYSDLRSSYLNMLAAVVKYRLGLTFTFRDKGRESSISKNYPLIADFKRDTAIDLKIATEAVEYNIPLDFDDASLAQYTKFSDAISILLGKFDNNLGLAQACLGDFGVAVGIATRNGWYKGCDEDINKNWNPKYLVGASNNLMKYIRARLNLMYNHDIKLEAGLAVLSTFKDVKTICFSESSEFIDRLVSDSNKYIYPIATDLFDSKDSLLSSKVVGFHSNLETRFLPIGKNGKLIKCGKDRLRKIAVERMLSGSATVLCGVQSLDTGINIPKLRLAVSFSGTQNPIQYMQRRARIERVDLDDENKTCTFINLYFRNTRDEESLKARQKRTGGVIRHANINNLNFLL